MPGNAEEDRGTDGAGVAAQRCGDVAPALETQDGDGEVAQAGHGPRALPVRKLDLADAFIEGVRDARCLDIDRDQTIGRVLTPARRSGPLVILPAFVAVRRRAGLAGRSPRRPGPTRPPGQGGNRPLPLDVRLDAVAAVLLDGLSYRRAARMVGISKTEVGDSLDLLLPKLAALGYCQPDGSFITSLEE